MRRVLAALALAASAARAASPTVTLGNAAAPGTVFPVMGQGNGGYGHDPNVSRPECWSELSGCGNTSYMATLRYLELAYTAGEKMIRLDGGLSCGIPGRPAPERANRPPRAHA